MTDAAGPDEAPTYETEELTARAVDVLLLQTDRSWTSGTFACHRQPMSCVLACCCPCVQFGFNQRVAFRDSCLKWTIAWLLPFLLLWALIVLLVPSSSSQAELLLKVPAQ